ncbi:MAG: hypothetical protein LBI82_06705 [Dysgonamonadaceae bacterium]|jgi:hypothetical protein|nr:hypothetical protein [Dysgonamonadaceae bacterium]
MKHTKTFLVLFALCGLNMSRLLLLVIVLAQLLVSCSEIDQVVTGKDCVDVVISGSLQIQPDGMPLADIPVRVIWIEKVLFWNTNYRVTSGNTTSDGRFVFNTQLDTSLFRGWKLYVRIPSSYLENYVTSDNIWNSYYINRDFTHFDRTQLQNVIFDFYHKADLKIKFTKTSGEQINSFSISYNFDGKDNVAKWYSNGGYPLCDSVIVRTAADVTTTVTSWKIVSTDDSTEEHSVSYSLMCKKDANNVIEIEY